MGVGLAREYDEAARVLDVADGVLDLPVSRLLREGSREQLAETAVTQPLLLTVSWMTHEVVVSERAIEFDAYAGLSTGEYVSLVAAGSLEFEEALRLVEVRGQAMQTAAEASHGSMVALFGADAETAQALCDEVREGEMLEVATVNGPQTVVAGSTSACERALANAESHGIPRADPLDVNAAFHTSDMEPAREPLARALEGVDLKRPQVPVYTNVTGAPVEDPDEIRDHLLRHLTEPALWAPAVEHMSASGVQTFVEMGPGTTLQSFIKRIDRGCRIASVHSPEDVDGLRGPRRAVEDA